MADTFRIPEFEYKGIKRIEIPKVDSDFVGEDFGASTIRKYLPYIMGEHSKNAEKIKFFYNYFLGMQDVLAKQRLYNKDADNNNKTVENHAFRQVNFKVGFLTGEKRDYTQKSDSIGEDALDDLMILDRYFTDCGFFSKDKDLKEWVYATGIGATYTVPRTDIIVNDGNGKFRYKTVAEGYNVDFEAPFKYSTINPIENFVVYSSVFEKDPLFCVSIVEVDVAGEKDSEPEIRKEMHIETRYASFVVQSDIGYVNYFELDKLVGKPKISSLNFLPIIEYSTNNARMGIVELNRDMFNAINSLKSSVADMIVDNANAILVFKNVDIDGKDVQEMKKAGAIIIGNNASQPTTAGAADLDTITIEIPFDGLNTYYDQTLQQAYDIAGVPLASGQVTSGGDTGQARLLGGGWNNAYIVINNDITTLLRYDYEQLKLILQICRTVPNCKLGELKASQIDIKYRINQNDNFLVKTQGIMNLYGVNMPLDEIAKSSGLFSDIPTLTSKWQKRIDEINAEKQKQTATENINVTEKQTTNGNNSQESL